MPLFLLKLAVLQKPVSGVRKLTAHWLSINYSKKRAKLKKGKICLFS
jgi:hypothetical protein